MEAPQQYFDSAVDLLGERWLETQRKRYFDTDSGQRVNDISHEFPIPSDDPPNIVKQYRISKEDLEDDQDEFIEFPKFREDSLRFYQLGKIFEEVIDCPILDPDGEVIEELSTEEFYRGDLRDEEHFEAKRYEMEVAASYASAGYSPGFVAEHKSTSKSPDIILLDTEEETQIECKRCATRGHDAETHSNNINLLFENTRKNIDDSNYIALFDLSRPPTRGEINTVSDSLSDDLRIPSAGSLNIQLPFGTLFITDFLSSPPFKQPAFGLEGMEYMAQFYNSRVRPVLAGKLGIDEGPTDLGNWILSSESQRNGSIILNRDVIWMGLKEAPWNDESLKRFKRQFRGVTDKFDDCCSILHIDYPEMNEGDSYQEIQLRKKAGGELKQRPAISAVTVSGLILNPIFADDKITRRTIFIPNYGADHEIPDSFGPSGQSIEQSKSADQLLTNNVRDDLLQDPDGHRKAVAQDEGSISFRFKPNEAREFDEAKKIFDIISPDGDTRLLLEVTPEEWLRVKRLDHSTGFWTCQLDISEIPDFEPMKVYVTWSGDEIGLSVGSEAFDGVRHSESQSPESNVPRIDGELKAEEEQESDR